MCCVFVVLLMYLVICLATRKMHLFRAVNMSLNYVDRDISKSMYSPNVC